MNGISVIIPARMEKYMPQTVYDVLSKAEGDIEVIAIFDGCEPDSKTPKSPKVKIVHNPTAIGQRQAINQGAELAQYDYLLKTDGHSMFDQGFDRKLIADMEPNWTVIPRMYNLNGEKWEPKWHKKTDYMFFRSPFIEDKPLRIQYWDGPTSREFRKEYIAYKKADYRKGTIAEVMNGQGACFFMHRDWFFELGGMDVAHGHWGQMGVEVACKTWLHGGRHIVNKNTWFAHQFRSAFPWPASGRQQERARKYSIDLWSNNKWPGQIRPLSWIIEKFGPIPTWLPEHIQKVSKLNGQESPHGVPEYVAKEEDLSMCSPESQHLRQNLPQSVEIGHFKSEESKKTEDLTLLYYTANAINETCQKKVLEQLSFACPDAPLITVSQKPMEAGKNICVGELGRSYRNIYMQVLEGAKAATTDYVALVEDDTLYVKEHFDYRPAMDCFAYNLNRWLLHEDTRTFSYREKAILSQCIAPRKLLVECLEARLKHEQRIKEYYDVNFGKKYGGEPGPFEDYFGLYPYKWETFRTEIPNLVVCHPKNTSGRKYVGKNECAEHEYWGNAEKLLQKLFSEKDTEPMETKEVRPYKYRYRKPRARIGNNNKITVEELYENRFAIAEPRHRRDKYSRDFYYKAYDKLLDELLAGKQYTDAEIVETDYYKYLESKLNPKDLDPVTAKGRRHAIKKFRDAISLFEDIRKNGMKNPLVFYLDKRGNLMFYRGSRRLPMLHKLGINKVPMKIFRSFDDAKRYEPENRVVQWQQEQAKGTKTINEIAAEHFSRLGELCTDKYWVQGYIPIYDNLFQHIRNERLNILEFGVLFGASLRLWHDAFPKARIYGVDRHPSKWKKLARGLNRVKVFIGDQTDKDFLEKQVIPNGRFNIIIDDCGHEPANQMKCFEIMYPHLKSHGFYVIEDCWHSYHKEFNHSINTPRTFAGWIDKIYTDFSVLSLQFYYNLCVIQKGL